ncbi:flavodoxin family protein [Sinimarinibacterium sp. CAU 1509]|nr:flavodoxin family protein [Sinimarinibacterium sp. CAU 1509]
MNQIVVVYHSPWGHTAAVANAIADGVTSAGTSTATVISVDAVDSHWQQLDAADALIFGCPTYMGNVTAGFKAFMDASGSRWLQQRWRNKLAAGFTNSGSPSGDKLQTLIALTLFAAQHGMLWIGNDTPCDPDTGLNRSGSYLGVMTESRDTPVGPDNPPASDLETARRLGRRVAETCARMRIDG